MVKEWLKQGRKLKFEIDALKEACQKALNSAVGGAANYSRERVQTSNNNTSERNFTSYSDYCIELKQRIKELEKYRWDMLRVINAIPDTADGGNGSVYRTLLIEYYINCKTWEEVAEKMSYSIRALFRIHTRALEQAEMIYKY